MKQTRSNKNFKQFQERSNDQFKCCLLLLLLASIFTTSLFAQENSSCHDEVLDFSKSSYHWPNGSLQNSYEVANQHFDIQIKNPDKIVRHVQEAGEGLKIGTNPNSVTDKAILVYNLSQSTSNVKFSISDLDYKNYGYYGSKQQEAVRIVGYCNGVQVLPKLRNISGSVYINGNYAVATQDSKRGYEESIEVSFNDCINQIKIEYVTGPNSPTHNPSYGKIYIGKVGGILASTCNSNCHGCEETCTKSTLNFKDKGNNWHTNSLSGQYTINDQSIDVSISDKDHILHDTQEYGAALKIGIDPKTKDDVVEVRYQLSQTSDHVKFVIRDLDYKHYGYHSSNQQEKVCIYGYRNGTEVLPVVKSLEGSVQVSGNCAEAMANSAHGYDESVEVCFNECIDEVLIVYGSGSKVPVHNPTYSKIYIGDDYGFLTGYCKDTCIDCELVVETGPDKHICPGDTIELTTEVVGNSCGAFSPNEAITYLWSTGETTPTIMVSEPGIYEVTVTDCNGCTATGNVELVEKPQVMVDVETTDNQTIVCEGSSFTIAASSDAENLVWNTGETGPSITGTPEVTTTYTVTASSPDKCPASYSVVIEVINLDLGEISVDPNLCREQTMGEILDIEIVEAAVNNDQYEQYFLLVSQPDGTILEYIKYTDIDVDYLFDLTRRNNGEYSVHSYVAPIGFLPAPKLDNIILNSGTLEDVFISQLGGNFCAELDFDGVRTEITACLRLDQASIMDYEIFPNPATDKLYFSYLSLENLESINITNIKGQVIKEIPYKNKAESMVIDIKDLQSGIYLLNVQTALKVSSTKFIVN